MSIRDRIRRLEGSPTSRCSECRDKPEKSYAYYPQSGDAAPEPKRCQNCGRPLGFVVRVVYAAKGGGDTY